MIAAGVKAQQSADQTTAALNLRVESLTSDLAARDREKATDASARQKLETELDDLRKVMAAKSSEDIKRQEADRSREAEMSRLREQAASAQKALGEQREQSQQLSNKLRVDLEGIMSSYKAADKELKGLKVTLHLKEKELLAVQGRMERADGEKRGVEGELKRVRESLAEVEKKLQGAEMGRDVSDSPDSANIQQLSKELSQKQTEYENLEDAVLEIEAEKADWARRMDSTSRQLVDESARRQHFEQQLLSSQLELAEYRNTVSQAERDLLKASGDIKERDKEIALLRSRENKTIVEHVHVLESAKKYAEKQLHEQVGENRRLNGLLKNLEAQRNRLQGDMEDLQRQIEVARVSKSKEARKARVSMTSAEREVSATYEEEKRGRLAAEAKVASLEIDVADYRRQLSTRSLQSGSTSGSSKREEEYIRLKHTHEATLAHNQKLQAELAELQRSLRQPTKENLGPVPGTPSRADLLRGLEKSHDALGRDMSEQLRKLDATPQPLTPSRRHNASLSLSGANAYSSPSVDQTQQQLKRARQLESEIEALRNQLEEEREEKEWLHARMRDLESGQGEVGADGKVVFPCESLSLAE